jgi:hypothetical protein
VIRSSIIMAVAALAAPVASAAAAPPGLPGPPPGTGTGLPIPPAPGASPGPAASLGATTLPTTTTGPGVLTGYVALSGSAVSVKLACSASGSATLLGAKTTYRCQHGRSTPKFVLTKAQAAKIPRLGGITAKLTVVEAGKTEHLTVSVSKILPAPSYWTSNFGLACTTAQGSNVAQLVAPNFSASLPTTIDVRPWLAWYTSATGWQWLGSQGPGKSSWYRWTATPSGVFEWQQSGTINPWTWSPISVTPGHGTYVVAVFEAVYWYGNPAYVWNYAHSQPGSLTTDCVYP